MNNTYALAQAFFFLIALGVLATLSATAPSDPVAVEVSSTTVYACPYEDSNNGDEGNQFIVDGVPTDCVFQGLTFQVDGSIACRPTNN